MMSLPTTFTRQVEANVHYWLDQCQALTDKDLARMDAERGNLLRAIEYGMLDPGTAEPAVELIKQLLPLIERRGYWREWIPMLESAIASTPPASKRQLELRNQLGFVRRLNRDLEIALDLHLCVIAEAGRLELRRIMAEGHFHAATAYFELHNYSEAQSHGEKALAGYRELQMTDEDRPMAAVLNLMGQVALAVGAAQDAADLFFQASERWQQAGDQTYRARSLINLGRALTATGEPQQALDSYAGALALLEHTTSDFDKTAAHLNLGVIYYQQEDWEAAAHAFLKAGSPALQRSGNHYLQAFVQNNLGHVRLEQGRLTEAITHLEKSVHLWQQAGDELMRGNSLGALAGALLNQGRRRRAIRLYKEAITLLERYPDDVWGQEQLCSYREGLEAAESTDSEGRRGRPAEAG
jgi:tetratricopeptide (TPR) repeat protein